MQWFGDFTMNINKLTGAIDTGSRASAKTADATSPMSAKGDPASGTQNASYSDQVKLSASSKSIQQVEAEISAMPEVNDAAVDRIRAAIDSGEYKIDYEKLAGKMLDFEGRLN
tara:strand:- start:1154 stop:1492 length:339 start_codon:yes stop_codon:yes gene_type:complete